MWRRQLRRRATAAIRLHRRLQTPHSARGRMVWPQQPSARRARSDTWHSMAQVGHQSRDWPTLQGVRMRTQDEPCIRTRLAGQQRRHPMALRSTNPRGPQRSRQGLQVWTFRQTSLLILVAPSLHGLSVQAPRPHRVPKPAVADGRHSSDDCPGCDTTIGDRYHMLVWSTKFITASLIGFQRLSDIPKWSHPSPPAATTSMAPCSAFAALVFLVLGRVGHGGHTLLRVSVCVLGTVPVFVNRRVCHKYVHGLRNLTERLSGRTARSWLWRALGMP